MGLKLVRVPGREIVANFEIVGHDTPPKADPNAYYDALGLDPAKDHSEAEIKRAYWVRAKKYHPDGSSPDPKAFHRVQTAYGVLKDPESRAKYDALDPTQRWLDEDIIAAIIKNVLPVKNRKETVDELAAALDGGIKPPPKPEFHSYAYYHYEGEQVPSKEVRDAWAAALIQEMWNRGISNDVRLGFTSGEPHVIHKSWGDVLMMAGDPSTEIVSNILDFRSPGSS